MSRTYTASDSATFTITNARYLASKVKTDLMRMHRYYYETHGSPSPQAIEDYHDELVLLQRYDFLHEIEYGFHLNGKWLKALKYAARQGGVLTADDDPGGIRPSYIPQGAHFASCLQYNQRWNLASAIEKREFLRTTPIERFPGKGYYGDWIQQRAYSSGGRGLLRSGI